MNENNESEQSPQQMNETPEHQTGTSTTPPKPKHYRRPQLRAILKLFPPEHQNKVEHHLSIIAAATPFTTHPIDAIATAIHRLATDLQRITLAHNPNTPPDDPNKIVAIAALAAAAKANITQPATSRLQRILDDVADLPPEPSTTEDKDDLNARRRREKLQQRLDLIRQAQTRRHAKAETAAQQRAEAVRKEKQKRRQKELNAMKKRVREREKKRRKNFWE